MRILRPLLVVVAIVGTVLLRTVPTFAIETESFGLDVAEASKDGRLHIGIEAGETSTGTLRVWNKQQTPLELDFSVSPARVGDDGSAALGGDDEPVGWVDVEPSRVTLEPGQDRQIKVSVRAPRKLDGEVKTVAVLASPAVEGEAPAVLQRLAITTFLEPDKDSLIASLGPFPWIAGAVLLAVVIALVARSRRREPTGTTD